jgi:hypothetical protein
VQKSGCGISTKIVKNNNNVILTFDSILPMAFLDHGFEHLFSLGFPFFPILKSIVQIFITGHSKDAAFFQLSGEGDDVTVKEKAFSLVPEFGGVLIHPSLEVCHI